MPSSVAKVATWSNSQSLLDLFLQTTHLDSVRFMSYKGDTSLPYVLLVIDLGKDLADISQKIVSAYDHCRTNNQKLTVLVIHGETVDDEKNLYFAQLLDRLAGGKPAHRLVLAKDLYHPSFVDSGTCLEKYVIESLVGKKIEVSSKGENLLYPLSLDDLLIGLRKIMFLSGTAGKTFWLVGDPVTDLELAYLLKKHLEDLDDQFDIEAVGANKIGTELSSLGNRSRAALNWEPESDFSADLKNAVKKIGEDTSLVLSELHRQQSKNRKSLLTKIRETIRKIEQYAHRTTKPKNKKKNIENTRDFFKKALEIALASLAGVYLTVTLVFIVTTAYSLANLEKSLLAARNADISGSVRRLNTSNTFIKIGESAYTFVSPIFSFLAPSFHEKNHNLFVFIRYSVGSLENLQQTYLLAENIYRSIGSSEAKVNYQDVSLALRSNLGQVYENINQLRLLSQSGNLPDVLEKKINESAEFKNLSLIEQQVTQLLKSVELLPAFLTGDQAKNIVVLFQNSFELRSTGGAVDYLLVLVLDKGRLVGKNIYSASDIDKLITEEVPAPPLINRFTGSENWKVRDLNYNPDFTYTAANFSAIIEKSLKFKPDIIMAVNDSLIRDMLSEDKGTVIDGQNITTTTFVEELPKKSPNPLFHRLIDHYTDQIFNHQISLLTLGRVISRQAMEGQLLVWSNDPGVESSILSETYSGAIYPHPCHSAVSGRAPCIAETTYLSESNFSLVPLKNDVQKKTTHKVSFGPQKNDHEYLIEYKFTGHYPGLNRALTQIIQLYAPQGSVLNEVLVNKKPVSLNSIPSQPENRLERYQIPVSLNFNSENTILISFSSPHGLQYLPFAYSLTEYRQPGIPAGNNSTELLLTLPASSRATVLTAPAVSIPTGYSYIFPAKTSTFGIGFEPKSR